jgi:hypothetical protein
MPGDTQFTVTWCQAHQAGFGGHHMHAVFSASVGSEPPDVDDSTVDCIL